MTRFLPGEMRDAFQNYVPKSMPMTWVLAQKMMSKIVISGKIFMIFNYTLNFTRINIWGWSQDQKNPKVPLNEEQLSVKEHWDKILSMK